MSETSGEQDAGDAWGTPDDGWGTETEAEPEVAEAEVEAGDDPDGPDTATGEDIVDAEIVSTDLAVAPGTGWGFAGDRSSGREIVPWTVTDDPSAHGWRQPAPVQPAEHGQRPSGGSRSGAKGDGAGSSAGTSKTRSRNPFRRRKGSTSGGGGDVVLYKKTVNKTVNMPASHVLSNNTGAKVTGNTAGGIIESPRRRGGASARIAGRRK